MSHLITEKEGGMNENSMLNLNKSLNIYILFDTTTIQTIFTYFNLFTDMFQITGNTYFILLRSFISVSFSISARLVPV